MLTAVLLALAGACTFAVSNVARRRVQPLLASGLVRSRWEFPAVLVDGGTTLEPAAVTVVSITLSQAAVAAGPLNSLPVTTVLDPAIGAQRAGPLSGEAARPVGLVVLARPGSAARPIQCRNRSGAGQIN